MSVGNKNAELQMTYPAFKNKVSCAPLRTGLPAKQKKSGPVIYKQPRYEIQQQQMPIKEQPQIGESDLRRNENEN